MTTGWEAPAIVLQARPYGENDALVQVLTAESGLWSGLVRGGQGRHHAPNWQSGNLVMAAWSARLSDQLGTLSGELVHASAAAVLEDALALTMLRALCAVAAGTLPERESHPALFDSLIPLLVALPRGQAVLPDLIRWELLLLRQLGFGLDLTCCAVSGARTGLAFVSPRSGHAVSAEAAGDWRDRLLPLPAFLVADGPARFADLHDGLALTGHFLARDAFGQTNRPLPQPRIELAERVARLAAEEATALAATPSPGPEDSPPSTKSADS